MTSFSSLEHLNSNNSPFKFNAKELDCLSREVVRFGKETGNYYYGARYYDPKFSIWLSVDPLAEQMPEWSSYAYTFNNPVNFTDPTGMVPEGGGSDDPPCCDDYVGDLSKVQQLDEVVVTAVRKNKKQREHMPAHMKIPSDWWNSSYEGDMNEYNAEHGTDYKDDGTALGYWQYDNFYEKEYKDLIRSIHEATSTAAEYLSYILPMPIAGGALIAKAPSLVRGAKVTDRAVRSFNIAVSVRGDRYLNLAKRSMMRSFSAPLSKKHIGIEGQKLFLSSKKGMHLRGVYKHEHKVINSKTFLNLKKTIETLNRGRKILEK